MHHVYIVHMDGSTTTFHTAYMADCLKRVATIACNECLVNVTIVYTEDDGE